ncbi:MAG: thioredoxin family protein [Candidatus Omnitrophota bacterium]
MSLAASVKIPMGTLLPSFALCDLKENRYKSDDLFGALGLLVVFTCNHCRYVNAFWPRLARIAKHAKCLGINTVFINPHIHCKYSENKLATIAKKLKELKIDFPYLIDDKQAVTKNFQAQCTPEVFLYDQHKKLIYHGRIDDNWQDENKVTSFNLKLAVDALAAGQPIERRQISSVGSSIQWRAS